MLLSNSGSRTICFTDEIRNQLDKTVKDLWRARDRIEDDDIDHVPIRDDEKEAIQPLIEYGYTYIEHGCGRIVLRLPEKYNLDDYIVKLSRFGNDPISIGMWQNGNELKLWKKFYSKDYPLIPVCDWQEPHAKWLIMKYGTPVEKLDINSDEKRELILDSIEELSELSKLSGEEFVPSNFVIYNNNPLLADYGRHNYD